MYVRIKDISVLSAFKIGCLVAAFPAIICNLAFWLFILPIIPSTYQFGYFITGPAYAIFFGLLTGLGPAIACAILALIYDCVAYLFGGLHVELERERRPIREVPGKVYEARYKHEEEEQSINRYGSKTEEDYFAERRKRILEDLRKHGERPF